MGRTEPLSSRGLLFNKGPLACRRCWCRLWSSFDHQATQAAPVEFCGLEGVGVLGTSPKAQ